MPGWSPEFFQTIAAAFVNSSLGWTNTIFDLATPVFWMMATITLGWVLVSGFIGRDVAGMASELGMSLVLIGSGWVMFQNAGRIGFALYNTFYTFGGSVAGIPASELSPDGVMLFGAEMFTSMESALGFGTWFLHPLASLLITVIAIVIFLFFIAMALYLSFLIIEAYIAITAGTMFIPFGMFHWTHHFLIAWLGWILGACVQIFFTFLMLGIAMPLMQGWAATLEASSLGLLSNLSISVIALAQTIVFFTLVFFIPRQARKLILGSVSAGAGFGYFSAVGSALASGGLEVAAEAAGNLAAGGTGGGISTQAAQSASYFSQAMMQP
jgi:P-type conjugative transfer protein TrbL